MSLQRSVSRNRSRGGILGPVLVLLTLLAPAIGRPQAAPTAYQVEIISQSDRVSRQFGAMIADAIADIIPTIIFVDSCWFIIIICIILSDLSDIILTMEFMSGPDCFSDNLEATVSTRRTAS